MSPVHPKFLERTSIALVTVSVVAGAITIVPIVVRIVESPQAEKPVQIEIRPGPSRPPSPPLRGSEPQVTAPPAVTTPPVISSPPPDRTATWISGITAVSGLIGVALTNWFAYQREKREAARAEADLKKVILENERLRSELDAKKVAPERRRVKRPS